MEKRPAQPRSIRFTEEEWARVLEKAAAMGLPPGRFIRTVVLGRKLASRIEAQAIVHLARIGTYLQQLVRQAEGTGRFDVVSALWAALDELHEALRSLR